MKCPNCGEDNPEGMKFCGNCGTKLPEPMNHCPNCNKDWPVTMRFCGDCGYKFGGSAASTGLGGLSIGDKNVIAGDVINTSTVYNSDETKQVRKCHVCGSMISITEGFECPECGQFTCPDCYDAENNSCISCSTAGQKSVSDTYKNAVTEVLSDGRIDLAERKKLIELQKQLGLSNEQAKAIEASVKNGGPKSGNQLTTIDKANLEKATDLYYNEARTEEAFVILEKLYASYSDNEDVFNAYIQTLASLDPDKALGVINNLGVDLFFGHVTLFDIYLRKGELSLAEKTLINAKNLWPENTILTCKQVFLNYALFKQTADRQYLEIAYKESDALNNKSTDHYERSLVAKFEDMVLEEYLNHPPKTSYTKEYCRDNGLYYAIMMLPLVQTKKTLTIGTGKYCDYQSLDEAIKFANDGQEIVIPEGEYAISTTIKKSIVLRGEGNVTLKQKPGKEHIIDITDGSPAISNVHFCINDTEDYGNCLVISGGSPVISDCSFTGTGQGISANAAGEIKNCEIFENKLPGIISSEQSTIKVTGCKIYGNKDCGVVIQDESKCEIINCEIFGNAENGIWILNDSMPKITDCKVHDNKTEGEQYPGIVATNSSNPTISGCEIYNHLATGIWVKENAAGTYSNCKIYGNTGIGIKSEGDSKGEITNCEIFGNAENGILFNDNSTTKATNCKIHDNKTEGSHYPGIVAKGSSNPTISGCEIYNHLSYAIWVKENAAGTYSNCKIYMNEKPGIQTEGDTKGEIINCEIFNNKQNGIVFSGNSTTKATNCKIHDNKTEGEYYPGIVAKGSSNPTVSGCEIYNHLSNAIWTKENASGTYSNCRLHDNSSKAIDNVSSGNPKFNNCQ